MDARGCAPRGGGARRRTWRSGMTTSERTTGHRVGRREERAGLLALAGTAELVALAGGCLAHRGRRAVLVPPRGGSVATEGLEPVGHERFLLGDVLACRAEVELAG